MVEGENGRCLGQPQLPQLVLGGVVMRIKWETRERAGECPARVFSG